MEKKNIKQLYNLSRMGFFACVFVALFFAGAFYQVFDFYPETELVFNETNNRLQQTLGIAYETHIINYEHSKTLKVKYFEIITSLCKWACVLGLLIAVFEYKLDPENHKLNKTLEKIRRKTKWMEKLK